MNWLMYIGGGFLWILFWRVILEKWKGEFKLEILNQFEDEVFFIAMVSAWIWICLKFIR